MAAAIEVNGLVKRYGSLAAVDGIGFTVPKGSVFSFLGPNGAGKTTTTEILEGLRRRTEGEVRCSASTRGPREKRCIAATG